MQARQRTQPSGNRLQLNVGCAYVVSTRKRIKLEQVVSYPRRWLQSAAVSSGIRVSKPTFESRQYFSMPVSRTKPLPPHHSMALPEIFWAMTDE